MKPIRFAAFLSLLALTACAHRTPRVTVELIDTSLSITPLAEQAVLGAVGDQILTMGRGDCLILIPITGNAANDAGGRILRLQAPARREPYDADLRRFQDDARKAIVTWTASVRAEPDRTDILGALDAAEQEIDSFLAGSSRTLVVVSDYLEEDGTYNFLSNRDLATPARARALALRLRAAHGLALRGVCIGLGRLESNEFASLSPDRKEAVTAFWQAYLGDRDQLPQMAFDGLGLLKGRGPICSRGQ